MNSLRDRYLVNNEAGVRTQLCLTPDTSHQATLSPFCGLKIKTPAGFPPSALFTGQP